MSQRKKHRKTEVQNDKQKGEGKQERNKETKAERPKNGDKGAHFSVSRYSVDELANALHEEDLPPIDDNSDSPLYLHIDCAHMGVGGDNSWSPVTLDEYFIPPEEEWEYSITIRPMKVSV